MWKKIKLFMYFRKMLRHARTLIENREESGQMVQSVRAKLQKDDIQEALRGFLDKIQALIRLADQYRLGNYREISKKSMVLVVAGLLYFLSPIDAIPDIIAGLGLVDDIAIISYVWKTVNEEIDQFLNWEQGKTDKTDTL
ncbi:YkvA family protein [Alkalihalobacillus sp. TS-13]|uniref:YkvA family protein n=1 Tax=Alkalihalobacillus sp. TS-13 TaxID=2842455 RepID=UPI001C87822B|nr:YkvA family protein [Alkalihalobacillus sp. TS-13]